MSTQTTTALIEKAIYKKKMKSDCVEWRGFLQENEIAIKDVYAAFNAKYPDSLVYEGFLKSINKGAFSYENYINAKSVIDELKQKIKTTK